MLEIAQQAHEKYLPVIRHYWLPLALGFLGLILFVYGLIALFNPASNKTDSTFAPAKQALDIQQVNPQVNFQKIVVYIEGAVVKPGIYSLALNSRVQDVLILASGLSDGAKIYIPRLGETQAVSSSSIQG